MIAFKIKSCRLFLVLGPGLLLAVIVTTVTGCVSGPFSSDLNQSPPYAKPTWRGDDHTPPVYTSPTVTPATNTWVNTPP